MYLDLNDLHNPATSAFVPAAWGYGISDNFDWLSRRPQCHAYQSSTQTLTTATDTDITFDAELRDNASIHSTVTDSSVFLIPTAGVWFVWCSGYFAANATGIRRLDVSVNNFTLPYGRFHGTPPGAGNTLMSLSFTYPAVAGAEFRFAAYQNSGGNLACAFNAGMFLLSL